MMKPITTERLADLLRKERKLELLEDYGVDNWDGYSEAINDVYSAEHDDESISYAEMFDLSDEEITDNYKTIH